MSSTIIYHQIGLYFPNEVTQTGEDHFAIVGQLGSSNCYEASGRRVRGWQALSYGSAPEVIRSAIQMAADCEGGSVKLRTMSVTAKPEQYITSIRNLLRKAVDHDITRGSIPFKEGRISCHFTHRVKDPNSDVEVATNTYLHEHDKLQALLRDPQFNLVRNIRQAYSFLKVSGPEVRSS